MTFELNAAAIAASLIERIAATDHSHGRQGLLPKRRVPQFSPPRRGLAVRIGEAIPRLSKAGMLSHSEGWGGLFKVEQYRLIRSASRASIRWLRRFEQTTPPLRGCPSLLRRGLSPNHTQPSSIWLKPVPVVDLCISVKCNLDSSASEKRGKFATPRFGQQPPAPVAKICRRAAALIGCTSRDILDSRGYT